MMELTPFVRVFKVLHTFNISSESSILTSVLYVL